MPYKDKEKQAAYQREWYKKNRDLCLERNAKSRKKYREFLFTHKDKPCLDCGIKYPHYVMDFDHREDKHFNISDVRYGNFERIENEIAKCDLVCANCHRERTFNPS